jgi:hypothetical protein
MSARPTCSSRRLTAVSRNGVVVPDASARAATLWGTPERETRRNAWFVWPNNRRVGGVTGTGRGSGRASDSQDVVCCQSLVVEEDHGASLLLEDEDESHQLRVDEDELLLHAGSDHAWLVVVEEDHQS